MPQCKFFLSANAQLQREYILLVDRSGSMSTSYRWSEACAAARFLTPYICKFDPAGITLMFFDHEVDTFEGIKSKEEVEEAFSRFGPRGSTDLALALHSAFLHHFNGTYGSTTILVVTDGCPNSQSEVERLIRRAANSIEHLGELSVSFIQIGSDRNATKFLDRVDHALVDAKYDIVDTVTAEECAKISFSELVARSIFD
jgi:Mg-chelatase subunit ChlD